MAIDISHLSQQINEALEDYTNEIIEGMEEAAKKNSRVGARLLKKNSPERTGDYAKGWRAKKTSYGKWTLYNSTDGQLTHLLEKGHAKVGGGRVEGTPHIAPVEKQIVKQYIKDVEGLI